MDTVVLVPDIHDLQTGGNVYNRRMVEELGPEASVRVVSEASGMDGRSDLGLSGPDAILLDSLLARRPDAVEAVRNASPTATVILLVHYLHCIDPNQSDPETVAAERRLLRAIDGAITTSRFARRAVVEEGVPADRVKVVPPGLDERYRGSPPTSQNLTAPRMLTVANLVPEKGLQSFVEVLRRLRSTSWTWTLVGDTSLDPAYAEGVFRRIREGGLFERVTYTGSVPPTVLRTWYDRADLFVLPSRFETRSLSTREAMARGLPIVGYRVGGMAENFGDAAAGHLVPPGDSKSLRSALHTLLTDPLARARKGRTAWRHSRSFLTWGEAATLLRRSVEALRDGATGTGYEDIPTGRR